MEEKAIGSPGWSISSFSVSGTPSFRTDLRNPYTSSEPNPYPNRRIYRPSINSNISIDILEAWAMEKDIVLGPIIPSVACRYKVLCLLYHYRYLDGKDLTDLPPTDLITHRVRIKEGTKPASNKVQKKWPTHTE